MELAEYKFFAIHKKRSENVNADALSRANHLEQKRMQNIS